MRAMPSVVVAATWMNMGSAVLIYLAALQGISGELYEAADPDNRLFSRMNRRRDVAAGDSRFAIDFVIVRPPLEFSGPPISQWG